MDGSGIAMVVPTMMPSSLEVMAFPGEVRVPPLFSISIQPKCLNSVGKSGLISRAINMERPSGILKLINGSAKLVAIGEVEGMLLIPNSENSRIS